MATTAPLLCIHSCIRTMPVFCAGDVPSRNGLRDTGRHRQEAKREQADWQNAMIAWESMPTEKANLEKLREPVAASLLYRLMIAFPSWAGALFVLYSFFMWRFGGFRIRPR